jgi:hypothetical protein
MTEETVVVESELDALKERATQMGIKFHPSSGVDSLKAKINDKMAELDTDPLADDGPIAVTVSKEETIKQRNARLKKEAGAQIRIQVTCMNPNKREWEGEIFTTGNMVVGTFKKYVPFETVWHVPQIILTMMRQRKCQVFHTVTDKRTGTKSRRGKMINEFAVEVLPDLTGAELKDLEQREAMAAGTADAA